ncbi:MFS transporter [Stenotrophomonas geniculata]|uniref:MFS transporter n=1 Tax=Stenotrophomonas geniculata N1 TaxID=1167641 RepID=A0A0L8A725_9GAMM|nr:MFS transporter [Stenotrophomonas geniculata]KOE97969.1 MFS transporter [Stenotrophomonas geniculata N1]
MSSLDSAVTAVHANARARLSVVLLAVSAFVIVTTEFLIVGLLPALARDLGLGIARAGQLVTLFAFTVMLAGPPLTALLSHVGRRRLFVVILLLFAASNALAAMATQPWLLALARVLPALALPVFWGTASETAVQLAPAGQGGRAVARVYLGITAAMLFGIPLGTLAADALGWRGSFWLLAALSLLMAGALALWMPDTVVGPRRALGEQARVLRQPQLLGHVLLSVLVFTAMFAAYTYLADVLERLMRVPAAQVGWWLMGFGAVGLLGNALGGRWVDRAPLVFCAVLALGMLASVGLAGHGAFVLIALVLWGVAHTALFPLCQVRVMRAAPQAQALAGTLNVSAANAGIGLGALLGGGAIERFGLASLGAVGAAVALLAIAAGLLLGWLARSRSSTHGVDLPH